MENICLFRIVFFLLVMLVGLQGLEDFTKFTEGACNEDQNYRLVIFDRAKVDSFRYVAGGSKLILYMLTASLPNYKEIREDEFYYDSCLTHNISTKTDSIVGAFGFGQLLFTASVKGYYVDATSTNPSAQETIKENIILTDNETFAVTFACLVNSNLRAFSVKSLGPNLSEQKIQMIEEHVTSLGFKKENFIFLRFDSCRKGIIVNSRRFDEL